MSRNIYPDFPPDLTEQQQAFLVTEIHDWSIANGLAVRPQSTFVPTTQDPHLSLAVTAPVTLFPSPFPRQCFNHALSIQQDYNALYASVAADEAWLRPVVEELIEVDEFMQGLWQIHETVRAEGYAQELSLGLFRSDYMVHVDVEGSDRNVSVKQVEFNTIASSFGGLSSKISAMHKFLAETNKYPSILTDNPADDLVVSRSTHQLARGLAAGHKAYGDGLSGLTNCIIFIVQHPERNVFDQRHIEHVLHNDHSIPAFRVSFADVLAVTKLDNSRNLIFTPPNSLARSYEVSTIYFRAGYSPDDYTGSASWDARLLLERSRAIKCPSILSQLSGAKKVQQVLATPESPHLSHFVPNDTSANALRSTFAPIYPLDTSPAGQIARRLALDPERCKHFVLKPQREGGGNNIYRSKIPEFLKSISETQWPAFILMEMIEPPPLRNAILRNGEVQRGGVIGELGVYGSVLWRNRTKNGEHVGVAEVLHNEEAGYLLRTKSDTSEEGGVAAGFGAVDSVMLV